MKMQSLFLFVVISLILLPGCEKNKSVLLHQDKGFRIDNNLSNQQVNCFAEDNFGYVWIGTARGANKYNGYDFLQYIKSVDSTSIADNQVQQILSDSNGRLWFATVQGLSRFGKLESFEQIKVESISVNIRHIREASDKRLFLNTTKDICEYDPEENRFVSRIRFGEDNQAMVNFFIDKANRLWCIGYGTIECYDCKSFELLYSIPADTGWYHYAFLRNNGELWVANQNQLAIYDTKDGSRVTVPRSIREHYVLSGAGIMLIHPYDDVALLIQTQKDGLFYYNTFTGEIYHEAENSFPFERIEAEVTSMFTDSNKNLWVGTYDQGFTIRYQYKQRFNTNDFLRASMENKSVISIAPDREQNLWIATRSHGLMVWHPDKGIKMISLDGFFPEDTFFQDRVNVVFVDSENTIWLMTYGKVLKCRYINGVLRREKTFYTRDVMNAMVEDHNGTLWTAGGGERIYALRKGEEEFTHIQLYPKGYNFTNELIRLANGKIMVASFLHDLQLIHPDTWEIEQVKVVSSIGPGLFVPTSLYEDGHGDIWITTKGAGLYRYLPHTGEVEKQEGIPCNEISSVIEDIQGNLWIGTLYGLSKYDRTVNRFTNYYVSDGIGGNQFNERSVCRLPDNMLIFGGTHGLTIFDPIDVSTRRQIPLFVEELRVHNQRVLPGDNSSIGSAMILNPEVQLTHDENSLQFSFAALDYSEFPRVQYLYKLDGADQHWVVSGNHRQAFYSNLMPGKYNFRVRITSHDDSVAEVETSFPVHIRPAPWLSIPALLFYLTLFVSVVLFILHLIIRNRVNQKMAVQALYEKEHEKKMSLMNMSFFSNISHEFRTPLTMISGPITQLCLNEEIEGNNKRLLFIVQRSVERMLRLVNQLMDFNKLENDTLKLKVEKTDVIAAIRNQIDIFRINADEKGITLSVFGLEDRFEMWLDTDIMEKIVHNLLSNALKFTKPGGAIDLFFDVISRREAATLFPLGVEDAPGEYVKISVGDTGEGIPEDKKEDIFKRYYQLDGQSELFRNWGTGIGLYFAKRLVEMHHGQITVQNKEEGGALFTFILPVNDDEYSLSERSDMTDRVPFVTPSNEVERPPEPSGVVPVGEKKVATLLVVDDDTDISYYMRSLLSESFDVVTRYDAETAWKAIEEVQPDLIVSDVVMPGTDGFEFCRRIKENISTSHIPVILLTAKSTVDDQVEGMNVGANAYVTKPFNPSYLTALINSQLRNRDNTRKILSETTQTESLSEEVLSPQDKLFMNRLYELMEKELSNPELNILRMTEYLGISRTKFYYKLKGLTGENPTTLFKNYKLNRAAELLRKGNYTIAEIADRTGFSTSSHFAASFKKKFGILPSKYVFSVETD